MSFIETAKELAELYRKTDNLEDQRKLLELQRQALEYEVERQEHVRRIAELEKQLRDKSRLEFRDNALWDKETGEGPFCAPCFQTKGDVVNLHATYTEGEHFCHACKTGATSKATRDRIEAQVQARERAHRSENDWIRSRY